MLSNDTSSDGTLVNDASGAARSVLTDDLLTVVELTVPVSGCCEDCTW